MPTSLPDLFEKYQLANAQFKKANFLNNSRREFTAVWYPIKDTNYLYMCPSYVFFVPFAFRLEPKAESAKERIFDKNDSLLLYFLVKSQI